MSIQSEEKSKTKRQSWGENEGLIDGKKEGHGEIQYMVHVRIYGYQERRNREGEGERDKEGERSNLHTVYR